MLPFLKSGVDALATVSWHKLGAVVQLCVLLQPLSPSDTDNGSDEASGKPPYRA